MSLLPQVLQQVQDSTPPSPILVVPFKPFAEEIKDTATPKPKPKKDTAVSIPKPKPLELNNKPTTTTTVSDNKTIQQDSIENTIAIEQSVIDSGSVVFNVEKDSIKEQAISPVINYAPSIFSEHELRTETITPQEKELKNNDWLIGLTLLISVLIVINKVTGTKKWQQQLRVLFSAREFSQLVRDEKDFRSPFLFLQLITAALTTSLFIFQYLVFSGVDFEFSNDYNLYFRILISIPSIFILYFISQKIAGFILKENKIISEYLITNILLFNLLGLFIFPVSIALLFTEVIAAEYLFYIGLIVFIIVFLFKLYKGFVLIRPNNLLHLLYLFLYICTLEILPVLITGQLLLENG
jgi:hypothetical protein